jgi:8-oxo-dGTP pyrophosphatase MutT (NUDIX family)
LAPLGLSRRASEELFCHGCIARERWRLCTGGHGSSPGGVYFPAGIPDDSDIAGDRVDLTRNLLREIGEETGLAPDDYEAEEGWFTVLAGPRIAQIKMLQAPVPAAVLRQRILVNLRQQQEPELDDVRIVRSPADFDPMMPPFVAAFLTHLWNGQSEGSR